MVASTLKWQSAEAAEKLLTDVPLEGGGTVKMDEAYIKTAIQNPNSQIHAGFPPSMPVTPLSDKEIEGVIEYIKTLK